MVEEKDCKETGGVKDIWCLSKIFAFSGVWFQGKLTYGKIGEWRFDKRSYDSVPPPRNLPLPPPGVPESVVCLLSFFTQAHKNILKLEESLTLQILTYK